jgi:hypothetical protein
MKRHTIAADDCRSATLAIRAALLEPAGLDAETEPVPLHGQSAEVDVGTFVVYWTDLFLRASAARGMRTAIHHRHGQPTTGFVEHDDNGVISRRGRWGVDPSLSGSSSR